MKTIIFKIRKNLYRLAAAVIAAGMLTGFLPADVYAQTVTVFTSLTSMTGEARGSIPMTLLHETRPAGPQTGQAETGTITAMVTKMTFTETCLSMEMFTTFLRPGP